MHESIFHKRLQNDGWYEGVFTGFLTGKFKLNAGTEPQLLNIRIMADK